MAEMNRTPGRFVWRDLMTTDMGKAKAYYGELLGWTFKDSGMPGSQYLMINLGEKMIGGLFQSEPGPHAMSMWTSYVSVPDVDVAAEATAEAGGAVLRPPAQVPGVGRFAVLRDFAGAVFTAFRDDSGDRPVEMGGPGEFCWESLVTTDIEKAKAFYGKVFGWRTQPAMDPTIPVFAVDDTVQGAVADIQLAKGMPPCWVTYVHVRDLKAVTQRAAKLGGQVLASSVEVKETGHISLVADPTGATIGFFQPMRPM